jgi:hypothetical protein
MKNTEKTQKIVPAELKRLAKKANRRMRELEAAGYDSGSPAYQSVQAHLEMMGRQTKTAAGRRFSEAGKYADRNDLRQQLAVINKFLEAPTSTRTGYESYRKAVYESADKTFKLKENGITQKDYEDLLNALPDKESDRAYYISYYIEAYEAYELKIKEDIKDIKTDPELGQAQKDLLIEKKMENQYSVTELIDIMENSKNLKDAYKQLGLTQADFDRLAVFKQVK